MSLAGKGGRLRIQEREGHLVDRGERVRDPSRAQRLALLSSLPTPKFLCSFVPMCVDSLELSRGTGANRGRVCLLSLLT